MQCWLAGPMILVNVLMYSWQTISVAFVGHLGELALSSASIATSLAGVTGSSLLLGMSCALETICGQAYGAKQYHLLGVYLQKAIVVLNATSLLLAVIWCNMEKFLIAVGQDPSISKEAGKYARWLIPTLFAYASAHPITKFLQVQSLVFPLVICALIALFCHVPICWFMVYKSGLGSQGAALATSISNWIYVVLMMIYVRFSRACEKSWTSFSWEALKDLNGFLKLALSSTMMICLEWWSYEAVLLLSGLLPKPQLASSALSICLTTGYLVFTIPLGLGAAVSTRVSNELGAGCAKDAQGAVHVGLGLVALECLVVSATLFSVRAVWGRVYSDDTEVIECIANLMPILVLSTALDSLQGILSGVVRGSGWQGWGAYINLGSYYIVGLPAGILMAFVFHFDVKGLLMGLVCGSAVQLIAFVAITLATNWEREAKQASARVQSSLSSTQPLLPS